VDWLEALERAEKKRVTHNTPPSKDDALEEENSNACGVRTDKTDKRVGVPCVHRTTAEKCALCSGYVRWLIADESRILRARQSPEAVRREFGGPA
jgi:hypothetical protein